MADSPKSSALTAVAASVVRAKALRLANRLGLRSQDREDLEQELWAGLLERWEADRERSRGEGAPWDAWEERLSVAAMRSCVARQVDQVAAAIVQSSSPDLPWSARGHPMISWREGDFAAEPAEGLRHLRLDLAWVLDRLPADLRGLCERLLRGEPDEVFAHDNGINCACSTSQVAALRRIFQAHGLHEYL